MAEPIQIIITQGGKGTTGLTGDAVGKETSDASKKEDKNKELKKGIGTALAVAGAVWGLTKDVLNTSVSLATDLTGNYIGQRRLNETLNVVNKVGSFGKSAIKGAIAGTAIGELLSVSGGGALGAGFGLGIAYNKLQIDALAAVGKFGINIMNTNLNASFLKAQSGNGNGSRGTNG